MKKLTSYTIISLVLVVILLLISYYFFLIPSKFTNFWPRLIVGQTIFSQKQITHNFQAYHKKNSQEKPEIVFKVIIESLIRQATIKELLDQNQLVVGQADVNKLLQNNQGLISETELNTLANDMYGWTGQEFINYVIWPLAEKLKLEEYFQKNSGNQEILAELEKNLPQLKSNSDVFVNFTKNNSDSSKDSHGYLGWVKIGQTLPQIEFWLLNLNPGQISEIIDTDEGYYIIKLHQRVVDGEKISFEYSQIFRQKKSFDRYLVNESSKIYQLKLFSEAAWLKLWP